MKVMLRLYLVVALSSLSQLVMATQVNIAIIYDGESPAYELTVSELKGELSQFEDADYSFSFPSNMQLKSQWNYQKAQENIRLALADSNIDIVVTIGLLSSDALSKVKPNKPVIAATAFNAIGQNLPITADGTTGVKDVHYLITNVDLESQIKDFQQATEAKHVGVLIDEVLLNSLPLLQGRLNQLSKLDAFKMSQIVLSISGSNKPKLDLPTSVDAIVILPHDRLTQAQASELVSKLNNAKIPTFTIRGRPMVEQGYLMGSGLIPSSEQLAKRLALDIRDIALGRNAGDLPVNVDVKDRLSLNMQTAAQIDFEPSFNLLFEADLINEVTQQGRVISLFEAIDESLRQNLQLAIAKQDLSSAAQSTLIAKSALLPQVSANANWQALDRDIAITRQTRSSTVSVGVTQSIYSERNYSQYSSSKFLEDAQVAALDETRLDVIQLTAIRYLNVLIAVTQLEIQKDNLKLTLANLERARFRNRVGSANRSEALRFETELGNDKQAVTTAQNVYQQSRNQLNQVLHRPIDELFVTQEPTVSQSKIFSDERLNLFLSTPKRVRIFSDFLTKQSLENAPELVNLNNQIASQERLLLAAKRKRFVPDVDLTADVQRVVDNNSQPFASVYDNDWSVGVQFSWTLFQGNGIAAERSVASIELQRLQLQYKQIVDQLETDTRNSVFQAGASRLNIGYALSSVEASEQTLALVTDSYVRGTASYIDLIDAQSSNLTARLNSSNAIYTHVIDLIALQRAVGFFEFYTSPAQQNQWFEQLNEYTRTYQSENNRTKQ